MKILKSKTFIILTALILFLLVRHFYIAEQSFTLPDYPKADISEALNSEQKTEEDYNLLYEQTGLSPWAADTLARDSKNTIYTLHELMFTKPEIKKDYILYPFTFEERNSLQTTPLAPLKDGDILITFNTCSADWRHGHCAIVTNAQRGRVIEHAAIGHTSCFSYADLWGTYPSFIVLRYPDEQKAKEAAEYAVSNLFGIEYNLFAGIFKKDKSDEEHPKSHCSHIVWQAYKAVGIDIDRDKGPLVTPMDIAKSKELKVVQVFGMDTAKYKDRLLK